MKYTSGKWNASPPLGEGDWAVLSENVNAGGNWHIATIPNGDHAEAEGNSRLIAAAPELLDACKWLLFHAENGRRRKTVTHRGLDFTDDEFEGRLRAAIAKAEGGE